MGNARIDYDEIANAITDGLFSVQAGDKAFSSYTLTVSQERQFVSREQKLNPNSIFVIISFGDATIDEGQSVVAVTLSVYGEQSTFDVAREILNRYATTYNQARSGKITQFWNTPSVDTPTAFIGTGYRTLFGMVGAVVYSGDDGNPIDRITYVDGNTEERVGFLKFTDSYTNSLVPQPKSNSSGRTKSVSRFSTYTMSLILYSSDSDFMKKIYKIKYGELSGDTTFRFIITHLNGMEYRTEMRIVSLNGEQAVGTQYTITATFSE